MVKVLVTDRLSIEALNFLKLQEKLNVQQSQNFRPLPAELRDAQVLLTRSRTLVDSELMNQAPELKLVVTATSGFDHIDLRETQRRNITVLYTPEGNQYSAAELTFALLLACSRKVVEAQKNTRLGNWDRSIHMGHELFTKSLGLVGFGRIGQLVSQMAKGFGMVISAFDPYVDPVFFGQFQVTPLGFTELLSTSDFVSFHVPYTRETHHMLNKSTMENLGRPVTIINTSRGSVINEQDLIEAISLGKIAAVGLDVFEHEPLSRESDLLKLPRVVTTPHIGALTTEAFERTSWLAAQKIVSFVLQGIAESPLPQSIAWFE